jgi:hypothetical protein
VPQDTTAPELLSVLLVTVLHVPPLLHDALMHGVVNELQLAPVVPGWQTHLYEPGLVLVATVCISHVLLLVQVLVRQLNKFK